jgi:hypothetical protein
LPYQGSKHIQQRLSVKNAGGQMKKLRAPISNESQKPKRTDDWEVFAAISTAGI